jgi:hypothetical protein
MRPPIGNHLTHANRVDDFSRQRGFVCLSNLAAMTISWPLYTNLNLRESKMSTTSFLSTIREANMQSLVKREQQVTQTRLDLESARAKALRMQNEAEALAVAEIMLASEPITSGRLLVMDAYLTGQSILRDAKHWSAQARARAQRIREAMMGRIAALQEQAQSAAEEAAQSVLRSARLTAQEWDTRLKAARHELDTLVALENPEESVRQEYEVQFRQNVVRRRDTAVQRLKQREKLAEVKRQSVLAEFDAHIAACHIRLECAERYMPVVEKRIVRAMDRARDEATRLWLTAQLEEIEISRLAALQVERAHTRAEDLRQNAVAQGELNIRLAEEAMEEARIELEEARRLAPQAASELDNRREAETLRKQVGRLARAGQVTEAMLALAQAKALDPVSPYLPGCEKAIQTGLQAQQVKEMVRQIEVAEAITELDALWARATELGITQRVESVWKGQKAKLQKAQERLFDWTNRYAADIARHIAEPGQVVMVHRERPGLVFVLDQAMSVVQLHQFQGNGCWKTTHTRNCQVNLNDLAEVQL